MDYSEWAAVAIVAKSFGKIIGRVNENNTETLGEFRYELIFLEWIVMDKSGFIELTGKTLLDLINDGEIDVGELHRAG